MPQIFKSINKKWCNTTLVLSQSRPLWTVQITAFIGYIFLQFLLFRIGHSTEVGMALLILLPGFDCQCYHHQFYRAALLSLVTVVLYLLNVLAWRNFRGSIGIDSSTKTRLKLWRTLHSTNLKKWAPSSTITTSESFEVHHRLATCHSLIPKSRACAEK